VTFYRKGSRNEHHWICLVKLKAEKKILVSFMVSKGEKNFKKDVITEQLKFACLYHLKYNSFLSCADLQQVSIFVFLVILRKILACLDAQASLNGVPAKLVYYVVLVLRTWIYTASCYYRVNAQHCME